MGQEWEAKGKIRELGKELDIRVIRELRQYLLKRSKYAFPKRAFPK